jgi:hypothetical protein
VTPLQPLPLPLGPQQTEQEVCGNFLPRIFIEF